MQYLPVRKCEISELFLTTILLCPSHINSICRSASLALRNIGRVRKYLDQANTERLVQAFITSRLDYCNSLLYRLPAKEISKLQRLQNSAARLVLKCKVRDHITPSLEKLHWLPVEQKQKKKQKTNKLYLTRVTLNSEITDKPVALGFQIELEFGNVWK